MNRSYAYEEIFDAQALTASGKAAAGRILLAEDYAPNAFVASAFLSLLGYHVDVATDGTEAVARFFGAKYDAVLLDIRLPGIDGVEVARRIRTSEDAGARTRIIGMTAGREAQDAFFCRRTGMDECLSKPFGLEDLAGSLQRSGQRGAS